MAKSMKIDFGGVDKEIRRGGRAAHIPEGDYLFKVVKHEVRKTKDGTGRYISWQMQCLDKKFKGKTVYHITSLKPDALWNLRNLIHACTGKNVAGRALDFTPESLYGKTFAGTTEDNEYTNADTGKTTISSRLADIRPPEDMEENEDDDDDEDTEEEDTEEEVVEDEDEDDEPEVKPKAKKKDKKKKDEDLEEVDLDTI